MAASESVVERFNSLIAWAEDVSDPRTKEWFLISSPYSTFCLVLLYLLVVWQGQRFMANKEAMQLKGVMMVCNFSLVLLNAYLFIEFFAVTVLNPSFNLLCQGVDYSDDENSVRGDHVPYIFGKLGIDPSDRLGRLTCDIQCGGPQIMTQAINLWKLAAVGWWFFFSKFLEFADTFIFILRKKNNQVSFLHVYHHATVPIGLWSGIRWVPGGASYLCAMVNSFIHILMYSYYFLSSLGPWIQPHLWWKRYLTSLQLIQFITITTHAIICLLVECSYPSAYSYALITYVIIQFVLFSGFYSKTYRKFKRGVEGHGNGGAFPHEQQQQQGGIRRFYRGDGLACWSKDK